MYISGNRDEEKIDRADEFIVDRPKPRQHLSFGAGHPSLCRRSGSPSSNFGFSGREIRGAIFGFKIMGPPQRLYSNFIRGIRALPVQIISQGA